MKGFLFFFKGGEIHTRTYRRTGRGIRAGQGKGVGFQGSCSDDIKRMAVCLSCRKEIDRQHSEPLRTKNTGKNNDTDGKNRQRARERASY